MLILTTIQQQMKRGAPDLAWTLTLVLSHVVVFSVPKGNSMVTAEKCHNQFLGTKITH